LDNWRTPAIILACGCAVLLISMGLRATPGIFLKPMTQAHQSDGMHTQMRRESLVHEEGGKVHCDEDHLETADKIAPEQQVEAAVAPGFGKGFGHRALRPGIHRLARQTGRQRHDQRRHGGMQQQ